MKPIGLLWLALSFMVCLNAGNAEPPALELPSDITLQFYLTENSSYEEVEVILRSEGSDSQQAVASQEEPAEFAVSCDAAYTIKLLDETGNCLLFPTPVQIVRDDDNSTVDLSVEKLEYQPENPEAPRYDITLTVNSVQNVPILLSLANDDVSFSIMNSDDLTTG